MNNLGHANRHPKAFLVLPGMFGNAAEASMQAQFGADSEGQGIQYISSQSAEAGISRCLGQNILCLGFTIQEKLDPFLLATGCVFARKGNERPALAVQVGKTQLWMAFPDFIAGLRLYFLKAVHLTDGSAQRIGLATQTPPQDLPIHRMSRSVITGVDSLTAGH